jgi:tetratricopeptide (TPR) repeat protein
VPAAITLSRIGHSDLPAPLVGREPELDLLARHLAGHGPAVLLLAGEPGIGKSRLLQEVAARAPRHGWRVLAGGCQRRSGQAPFAPLLDALDAFIGSRSPAELRAYVRGCSWLVRLLPELGSGPIEPLPAWTLPPEQERRLVDKAVGRFLANVAGPAGTLLLLDDVQWAGPDALELLATLVRSRAEPALRVVAAYRDTEVQPRDPLATTLADLAHAGLAYQHTLGPLAATQAGQLLDRLLEGLPEAVPAVHAAVMERSGGVPFYLLSYAQGLRAGSAAATEAVPWDVAQGVRQRVAALPPTAREVLGLAAVIGRLVPHGLLVGAATQAEPALLEALEVAYRARLLESEGATVHRFVHDVIREVVEAEVVPARRLALHRRVAEALERQPGEPPVELLAYHYAQGGEHARAAAYLEREGDRAAALSANSVAGGHYAEARRHRELTDADPLTLARLDEKWGAVLWPVSRFEDALRALEQAATTYRVAGDVDGRARVLAQMGWVHTLQGTPDEGIGRIRPLLDTLGASKPSPNLAELCIVQSRLYFGSGRYREALAAAERAVEVAHALSDEPLLGRAKVMHADALLSVGGRVHDGLRAGEEAIALLQPRGDSLFLMGAFVDVADVQAWRGELAASAVSYRWAVEVGERADTVGPAFPLAYGAWVAFMQGDWSGARAALERGLALVRTAKTSWFTPYPLVHLGRLCLAEGDGATARGYLQEAVALAKGGADLQALRGAAGLLAELDVLAGRPEAARTRLAPLLDHPGLPEANVTPLLPVLAWAHLEAGDVDHAAAVAAQAIARLRPESLRAYLVDALRVQAMIAIRRERWEEATAALEEGLELARSMPYPYAEGRLLHVYGQMYRQKGEPGPARQRLEAALSIFRRLGARKDTERVEQALAATVRRAPGGQPRPGASRQ